MNPLNRKEKQAQLTCLRCCVAVNWLDHSRTFREQGVDENETLLLRRKFFYSDQNVDSRDPVQLNLLYVQVPYLMLGHWGWWESQKPLLWLVLSRSGALASVTGMACSFQGHCSWVPHMCSDVVWVDVWHELLAIQWRAFLWPPRLGPGGQYCLSLPSFVALNWFTSNALTLS